VPFSEVLEWKWPHTALCTNKSVLEADCGFFGNRVIDAWLAETGQSPEDFNPVDRLCYIGRRNALCKRSLEGEEATRDVEQIEAITVGAQKVARTLRHKERAPDDDLAEIAKWYRAFRREHPEPAA